MIGPYETCPRYENENYMLRMVCKEDKEDLLKVYSDEKAVALFNSDNCVGDDFHYTTEDRMEQAIAYWL
ncbi:MAG: N-acetyltransferase, partial [Clostridiales bacterium]|nr:N-acetyltransferase [Clostridiales bacterium]